MYIRNMALINASNNVPEFVPALRKYDFEWVSRDLQDRCIEIWGQKHK